LKKEGIQIYERFTDRARRCFQLANQEAQRLNHEYLDTNHLLLGLVKEGTGVAANVLKNLDIDLRKIRVQVEQLVQAGPDLITQGKLPHTPSLKKAIEQAIQEASNLKHKYVGTEHLLLGILGGNGGMETIACTVLKNLGVSLESVREEVMSLLEVNGGDVGNQSPEPEQDFKGWAFTTVFLEDPVKKSLLEKENAELKAMLNPDREDFPTLMLKLQKLVESRFEKLTELMGENDALKRGNAHLRTACDLFERNSADAAETWDLCRCVLETLQSGIVTSSERNELLKGLIPRLRAVVQKPKPEVKP
jgi:ATP-dependent Clp protease ATP-binding subunit ClpA